MKITITTLLAVWLLTACGGSDKETKQAKQKEKSNSIAEVTGNLPVILVSDSSFTLNDKPAVTIYAGPSETEFCDITIIRGSIAQGASQSTSQKSNKDLSVSCEIGGLSYIESSNHPTRASVVFSSVDGQAQNAKVLFTAQLFNLKTKKLLTIDSSIKIENEHFKNLTL